MLHPVFSTLIQRPELVLDHVEAYAALLNQEARFATNQWIMFGVAWVLAGLCGCAFITFTGIALMLGFLHHQFHWILIVVPAAALLMTAVAVAKAKRALPADHFAELKAQIDDDARALRMAT